MAFPALDDAAPYLMKSVLNEAKGLKRARARRKTSPVAAVPEGAGRESESTLEMRELLDSLPAQQRAAAYLVFFEEKTAVETARLLGTQPATVRRYVHLARQRIERAFVMIDEEDPAPPSRKWSRRHPPHQRSGESFVHLSGGEIRCWPQRVAAAAVLALFVGPSLLNPSEPSEVGTLPPAL